MGGNRFGERLAQTGVGQHKVVRDLEQGQLSPQARFALTKRVHPAPDRRHALANVEVKPFDKRRNESPRSKLRGIKPPLADSHGPASLAGEYSPIVWMSSVRALEQPQLDVLAMPWRIALFLALLPHILANDRFISVTAYGTDEIAFRPKLATPQTLFDSRDALKNLTDRETFDDLDDFVWTIARYRLHQKMDVIFVGTNL